MWGSWDLGGEGHGRENLGPQAQPFWFLFPQMRTATRVFIRKGLCKRAPSPALGAPPSPAVLNRLPDPKMGSQKRLSPHSWARREVGPGASWEPAPLMNPVRYKAEPTSFPACLFLLFCCLIKEALPWLLWKVTTLSLATVCLIPLAS